MLFIALLTTCGPLGCGELCVPAARVSTSMSADLVMKWGRLPHRTKHENWQAVADRLDRISGVVTDGGVESRIEASLSALECAAGEPGKRSSRRHAAIGIPTREPLLQTI